MAQREVRDLFLFASVILIGAVIIGFGWSSRAEDISSMQDKLIELQNKVAELDKYRNDAAQSAGSEQLLQSYADIHAMAAQAVLVANEALSAAQESQACCDASRERLERLFLDKQ